MTYPPDHPRPLRVVLTGGDTGGHVMPALAVADSLRKHLADLGRPLPEYLYIGAGRERALVEAAELPFQQVSTGKLRVYLSVDNLTDLARVPLGILQARRLLRTWQPDVVLSTGGHAAVPVALAAWQLGMSVATHEQTTTLGLANRIIARVATRVALATPAAQGALTPAQRARSVVTGNPIRDELRHGRPERALATLELPAGDAVPTVYVTGGSLGAQSLNRAIEQALTTLLPRCRVIHQCGRGSDNGRPELERLAAFHAQLPASLRDRYRPRALLDTKLLADVYALADLVMTRAGAGTVTELAELGKPSVLVPLVPTRNDEQAKNAAYLAQAGAGVVLPQPELSPQRLSTIVLGLLDDPGRLQEMAAAAHRLAHPDAADRLAELVLSVVE
jgi:UDP-N-acetylglucosamine--N-acetylmuramyl-(pentapeptide) pyrophosphoryl-undecaprenol N-acetylglucosamine transferase